MDTIKPSLILHPLEFTGHPLCAKQWARCLCILRVLWSPPETCELVETWRRSDSSVSCEGGSEHRLRGWPVGRTLHFWGGSSSGLMRVSLWETGARMTMMSSFIHLCVLPPCFRTTRGPGLRQPRGEEMPPHLAPPQSPLHFCGVSPTLQGFPGAFCQWFSTCFSPPQAGSVYLAQGPEGAQSW